MAFAVEHHESPLPPNTLPPLHRRYPRSVLYVQTSPFISDTQEPITQPTTDRPTQAEHQRRDLSCNLRSRRMYVTLSASPHPRPYLV